MKRNGAPTGRRRRCGHWKTRSSWSEGHEPPTSQAARDSFPLGDGTEGEGLDRPGDIEAGVLALAAVKPGATVIGLMPGVGHYTRLFSMIVGPKGRVIALQPVEMASGGQDQITER